MLSINAKPLAFPPIDPFPIREKTKYSSKLSLLNLAIIPFPFDTLYDFITEIIKSRSSCVVLKSSREIGFKIFAIENNALAFNQREKLFLFA